MAHYDEYFTEIDLKNERIEKTRLRISISDNVLKMNIRELRIVNLITGNINKIIDILEFVKLLVKEKNNE